MTCLPHYSKGGLLGMDHLSQSTAAASLQKYLKTQTQIINQGALLLMHANAPMQVKGAECVVLAGDHKQLAPFVASEEAGRLGFSTSLFERLQVCPKRCDLAD